MKDKIISRFPTNKRINKLLALLIGLPLAIILFYNKLSSRRNAAAIIPNFSTYHPRSRRTIKTLSKEIAEYEKDVRFERKKSEAMGNTELDPRAQSIIEYLKNEVLQDDWKILELGCASGTMLREVQKAYDNGDIPTTAATTRTGEGDDANKGANYKELVGVELVTGWVKWAQTYYPTIGDKIHIYEGDITEFTLPSQYKTFDFVMMNDVMEHIMKERYGCFFSKLQSVTHPGSIVYMHTPTPEAQLFDSDQYFENVLPHHHVVLGMAMAGFELVKFEHDVGTDCSSDKEEVEKLPRQLRKSKCLTGGWTKYYHAVFVRKGGKEKVFALQ